MIFMSILGATENLSWSEDGPLGDMVQLAELSHCGALASCYTCQSVAFFDFIEEAIAFGHLTCCLALASLALGKGIGVSQDILFFKVKHQRRIHRNTQKARLKVEMGTSGTTRIAA